MSSRTPVGPPGAIATRAPVLLLTGRPGVGKTTLIRRLVESLGHARAAGFYTEEIRDGSVRVGFRAITLDGRALTMAHVDIGGPARIGKYGVDLAVVDALADSTLRDAHGVSLFVVDEIGRMECLATRFVATVRAVIDGTRPFVATIGMKGVPLLDELRSRPGVTLREVTTANRHRLAPEVVAWVGRALDRVPNR